MVSLLSIGTELTTGQILNKNAQWLSTQLLSLGLQVDYHLTVPDSKDLIIKALQFLELQSEILFLTGGLGPTSDDFTRQVVCEKYNLPLLWNEENWIKVQNKLSARKVQIRTLHRQQCEYPEGAEILSNGVGVADGFKLHIKSLPSHTIRIYVLPGPPKELEAIWNDHIKIKLGDFLPPDLKWIQKIWTTKGCAESEVAAKIREALPEDFSCVLYRVHTPFVDVKLIYQKKDEAFYQNLGLQIEQALKPLLVDLSEKD